MIGRRLAPVMLAGALVACSGSHSGAVGGAGQGGGSGVTVAGRSIDEVLAAHTDSLMALPGVVGTAIGLCDGERCIKVLLADDNPTTRGKIPPRLAGYRVVIEVSGTIRPH